MLNVQSAVGKVMNSIVYVLSDGLSNDYYLIDIGDFDVVQGILPEYAYVRGVFITHGHHDHFFGINKLKSAYPNSVVYASEECARMMASAKANLSAYLDIPVEYSGEITLLRNGDHVTLYDGIVLMAMATPGHNPSCLCFEVDNYLFTGDSYIPGVKVITNLPGGNKKQAQKSVERILQMSEGRLIMPGHSVPQTGNGC